MAPSPSLPPGEYEQISSPDPLASSQQNEDYRYPTRSPSPVKRSYSSPSKPQRSLASASATPPRKSQGQWISAVSPSKTVTEQTLSPWKIRVTIETEPENMDVNNRIRTSRTIMVPLRDASSPAEERSRTTRDRKSQSNTTKSQRSATPVRKSSRSRNRRQSVTDLDITVLGDDGDSNDWTKHRSPRKRKSTPSRQPQFDQQNAPGAPHQTPVDKPKRRTTRSAPNIEIREDTDVEVDDGINGAVEGDISELRDIDLNRVSVRSRSMSAKQRPPNLGSHKISPAEEAAKTDKSGSGERLKHASATSAIYPTPDPSVQDDQEVNEQTPFLPNDHENFDTILESEGFTMIDLESIPSARHFLSSSPEAQATGQSSETAVSLRYTDDEPDTRPTRQAGPHDLKPAPGAIPSYLIEGESDISSNVPSSPPVVSQPQRVIHSPAGFNYVKEITPKPYSSPKLPSPPRAVAFDGTSDGAQPRKSTSPTIVRIVKAGIALQGVLLPTPSKMTPRGAGVPIERLDNLFDGFDSRTRRELRAGLRFGEELAKRQVSSPVVKEPKRISLTQSRGIAKAHEPDSPANHAKHRSKRQVPTITVWQGEALVQHTPLQAASKESQPMNTSKNSSDTQNRSVKLQMRKQSLLRKETFTMNSSRPHTVDNNATSQSVEMSQNLQEVELEGEREDVSTDCENASRSHVVIIDVDSADHNVEDPKPSIDEENNQSDQDNVDIWCEEAASCEQRSSKGAAKLVQASTDDISPTNRQNRGQDRVSKPRRSVIPRTWRRIGNVADENSYVTNGDMTGLFEHEPKSKIKFGAAEIDRQRRQFRSGAFDIDRMAGTPHKPQLNITDDDSQVSANKIDSPESVDSDAQQLHSELKINQRLVDSTIDSPQAVLDGPSFSEHSLVDEIDVEPFDGISPFTEAESSLSLPPQPVKIPVNFNDSSVLNTAPCLVRSSPSTALESSRPNTPRSALKGARQSLGLEEVDLPAIRKVVFSTHKTRVDLDGKEETILHSMSSSYEFEIPQNVEEVEEPSSSEILEVPPSKKSGMLGWLWGGSKTDNTKGTLSTDAANDQDTGSQKPQEFEIKCQPQPRRGATRPQTASYLLPPSYPSDPTRDISIPMPTSGEFSDTHFRTLHIIYGKSLRPRFHAPRPEEVRSGLKKLLGTAFEADESRSGLGVFEWKVDGMSLRVLERFLREVEHGYLTGQQVVWGWTEQEVCERLFRIVVGEEVRKEEKAALQKIVA